MRSNPSKKAKQPKQTKQRLSSARFQQGAGAPRDACGLFAAMRRFVEHRAVLGATCKALDHVERNVLDFILWADSRGVTHPQQVSLAVLESYKRWLYYYRKKNGAPLAIGSQVAKLTPLRGFFKWLTRSGQIPANPAAEMEMPRRMRRLPRFALTAFEAEQVLAQADVSNVLGLRDRVLMEVLYATGMRRMEAANLEISDLDIARCAVLIREGKGGKDRLLPLGERALYWLEQYLERSRPELLWESHEQHVFLGVEGHALTADWLSRTVARYVARAELGKRGGCHLFRHTMATLMLENGADIRYIQAMLGHERLETTQIYTHVAIKQLQQVHARTHPGANRRVRSVQEGVNVERGPSGEDAAATLFAALESEAIDDEE